jgi:sulfur-carrier protein
VIKVLYFARFRQIIGKHGEDIELPATVKTVNELVDYLSDREPGCAAAFANRKIVRAAIDQAHVPLEAPLRDGNEVALFPPVTGG